ncbi:D-hexose-6-phosphate mutarotase [Vulcaniibacterium tengchongense]|uniref:Putative glucose-6-phosphate 1-epimerase n=1 Tax=Vulcaniibacterium tengchongense TaxID=1273429 RepID=A0A3N4V9D9_9GAMM|nr:D-hexose-6-phosphate mutarotase [Vulcaniibacterium tengchongense]RPE79592.1 glucose-6-phosphate 1-epimerase [Vulcaniibacterium tengchongense]
MPPGDTSAFPRLLLRLGEDTATVVRHGAHLLSWRARGRERLYLSPRAGFAPGRAIRGGVPVIFPQFSARGPGPRHGFARLRRWRRLDDGRAADDLRLGLADDADTRRAWPHAFALELRIALAPAALELELHVANAGPEAFRFTAALHTYLRVDEVADAALSGLERAAFEDMTAGGVQRPAEGAPLRFGTELDRVYPDAPPVLHLRENGAVLRIEQAGFTDTVVWNPGPEAAARLPDLGAGEHRRFVCVEAACAARPVELGPGERWSGRQRLAVADEPAPTPA